MANKDKKNSPGIKRWNLLVECCGKLVHSLKDAWPSNMDNWAAAVQFVKSQGELDSLYTDSELYILQFY